LADVDVRVERDDGNVTVLALPPGATLLAALREAGIAVTSICKGRAVCGMCRVRIDAGGAHLAEASANERRLLRILPGDAAGHRLSCQIVLESAHGGLSLALAEPVRRSRQPQPI